MLASPLAATAVLAALPSPSRTGFSVGPLDVRFYGLLIAVGAYLALQWTVRRYERAGGDPALAEQAGVAALVGGFLGARIGYVIPRLDSFLDRPGDILAIWQGGLTLFGGLAGGALAAILVVRRRGGDLPAFADAIAPALPLAQAIGRWGNYFNQELYGRPTDLPWAVEIEPRYRRSGFEGDATFHPTFLYESLWNLALVAVLVRLERRGRIPRGALMYVYLVGYGLGRAIIEPLRVDTIERYLGLSRNNWIAIAVILVGFRLLRSAQLQAAPLAGTDEASVPAAVGAALEAEAATAAAEAAEAADGAGAEDASAGDATEAGAADAAATDAAAADPTATGKTETRPGKRGRRGRKGGAPADGDASTGAGESAAAGDGPGAAASTGDDAAGTTDA